MQGLLELVMQGLLEFVMQGSTQKTNTHLDVVGQENGRRQAASQTTHQIYNHDAKPPS